MLRLPRRALLYGLGVWVGLMVVSVVLLPLEQASPALHESLKLSALVAITFGFTISYLRRVGGTSSVAEGLAVGVLWAVVTVALDLLLFLTGAFNIGLGRYFVDVASSYLVIPVVTVLAMGWLAARATGAAAATAATEPAADAERG